MACSYGVRMQLPTWSKDEELSLANLVACLAMYEELMESYATGSVQRSDLQRMTEELHIIGNAALTGLFNMVKCSDPCTAADESLNCNIITRCGIIIMASWWQ